MENNNVSNKCIIIGAGDLTVSEIRREEGDYVIAVDGGFMYCDLLGMKPDIVIGDFDSVNEEYAEIIAQIEESSPEKVIRLQPMKDDTDMLASVRLGLEKGFDTFYIYAGCGGRLEHTLANIQCLLYLKKQGAKGYMMDGNGMTFVMKDESVGFQPDMEGYLSLFSLREESRGVTIEGMKYPLDNYTVSNDFPIGISNEFMGTASRVQVTDGELAVIIKWE